MRRVLISESELSKYTTDPDIASRAKGLLDSQKESWKFLKENYKSLKKVETKIFEFDGFAVKVQNNPERIKSTTADVSANKSNIENSFLHFKNLPDEQKSLRYYKDYLILSNPYPIFPEHFTIPSIIQKPQSIIEHFNDFLFLTRDMQKRYVVFYNGPKCGASAPDHLHFQAGDKKFMQIDLEYENVKNNLCRKIFINRNLLLYFCNNYLRSFISLESGSVVELGRWFKLIYALLQKIYNTADEPMMNILAYYENKSWRVIIFPRNMHRPNYYFNEGESQIIISPGAVDMGGVLILPRKEDYKKITKEQIIDIYRQVSIPKEFMEFIMKKVVEYKTSNNV